MKVWKQWAARIDELTLRERGLAFVVAAASLGMIVHLVALQPLLKQQRAYLDRLRQDESQLRALNEALTKSAQDPQDPLAGKRERVATLERDLAGQERGLRNPRGGVTSAERLTTMLRDLLGREPNVRIVGMRVLPATPIVAPKPAPGTEAARPSPGVGLYRHGVEVEVAGTYLDLLRYLQGVETLPWELRIGSVELKTTNHPEVHLRATLSTVSVSASFLKL
jgi:MSHA biogenesis protein MshJ